MDTRLFIWLIVSAFAFVTCQGNKAIIIATHGFRAGIDSVTIECRPPKSWQGAVVFAIQLSRNTSNTQNHNVVSVYQGSTISWQDTTLQQRATASGQITDPVNTFLHLTVPAYSTQVIDAAQYTCKISGLIGGALGNAEVTANVSLIVPKLCRDGWIHNNGSCYHVNQAPASWGDAQKMCEIHGVGHLAHIQSAGEQRFLHDLLHSLYGKDSPNDYWVGGTDWEKEGEWVWEPSNARLNYTDWFLGQPNNGRYHNHDPHEVGYFDQNCLLLRHKHDFQWIDSLCSDRHFYVCERNTLVQPTKAAAPQGTVSSPPLIIG